MSRALLIVIVLALVMLAVVLADHGDEPVEVHAQSTSELTPFRQVEHNPPTFQTTTTSTTAAPRVKRKQPAIIANHGESVWDTIAACESGGDWAYNGPSGYDGGLQFHPTTWTNYGGGQFAAYAYQATPQQQIIVAERVLASEGWGAWPVCSRKAGLR